MEKVSKIKSVPVKKLGIFTCLFGFVLLSGLAIAGMNSLHTVMNKGLETDQGKYFDDSPVFHSKTSLKTKRTLSENALPGVMLLLLGEPDRFNLSISNTGAGLGKVHVSQSGTDFTSGTVVTLTADANLGSSFNGWSGACSGQLLIRS